MLLSLARICLGSTVLSVRDSFQPRKGGETRLACDVGGGRRAEGKLLCLFTPLYPKAVPSVYTRRSLLVFLLVAADGKIFMFNFFLRMLDIMSPDDSPPKASHTLTRATLQSSRFARNY
jgi:hypothetical protein